MGSPIPLPDHSTAELAGPGQPIHTEEYGQSVFLEPSAPGGIATDASSLHPGKYLMPLVLNDIFKLLSNMVGSIQQITVSQAQRLQFLSAWQTAYTNKMATVHTFVGGNNDAFNINDTTGDTSISAFRQDLNQTNSAYLEQMRANQSIIADDAKSLQSNVNQSTDAVNNQENMATSILQQFSSILTSIYR